MNRCRTFIPYLILLVLNTTHLSAMAADRVTGKPFATRSDVMAPHAMAATSHPLATQIALDILRKGGNAIDAAIAANAALGLMEPTGNGIGGDLFAIVWDAETESLYGLNGSGPVTAILVARMVCRKWNRKKSHPMAPCQFLFPVQWTAGSNLHGRFGRLPMTAILQPTIDYARNGHPVHETVQHYWDVYVGRLSGYPGYVEQMTIRGRGS